MKSYLWFVNRLELHDRLNGTYFQIVVLDYDSIISNGKQFALHLQAVVKEVELKTLICLVDKKTGDKHTKRPRFIQQDQAAIVRFSSRDVICMEAFKDHPQLGRFTLRDGGNKSAAKTSQIDNQFSFCLFCRQICWHREGPKARGVKKLPFPLLEIARYAPITKETCEIWWLCRQLCTVPAPRPEI